MRGGEINTSTGVFLETYNSEKEYYKNCTRDLSRKDLNTLRKELRESFITIGLQTILSMENACNILEMLTKEKVNNNKKYEWSILKQQR